MRDTDHCPFLFTILTPSLNSLITFPIHNTNCQLLFTILTPSLIMRDTDQGAALGAVTRPPTILARFWMKMFPCEEVVPHWFGSFEEAALRSRSRDRLPFSKISNSIFFIDSREFTISKFKNLIVSHLGKSQV